MSQPANVATPLSPNWRTHPKTRLEFVLALVERFPNAKIAPIGLRYLASWIFPSSRIGSVIRSRRKFTGSA